MSEPFARWVKSGKTKEQETAEAFACRSNAWQIGLAMIWVDDVTDDFERQVVTNIATRQYGERK